MQNRNVPGERKPEDADDRCIIYEYMEILREAGSLSFLLKILLLGLSVKWGEDCERSRKSEKDFCKSAGK